MNYPTLLLNSISNTLVVDPGSFTTKFGFSDTAAPSSELTSALSPGGGFYDFTPLQKQKDADFYVLNGEFASNDLCAQFFTQLNKIHPLD